MSIDIEKATEIFTSITDNQGLVISEWITKKHYIGTVAPCRMLKKEMKKIEYYCINKNIQELYYIPTDNESIKFQRILPRIIPARFEDIFKAEIDASSFVTRAIFPENLEFIIHTDGDEYHILIGSEDFIRTVFNGEDTVQEYIEHLGSIPFKSDKVKQFFYSLAERYSGKPSTN